jgi:hydroxymethylbilane synthase
VTARFVVATRGSMLARAQTDLVVRALQRRHPKVEFETRPIVTSGDRNLRPGGSPDFTDAIDRALLRGEVDLAVHSAKDLPVELPAGLTLAACPPRADARDCLVARTAPSSPSDLPRGARIGSSSLRRRAQLLRWRRDLDVVEIRGNVDSRLRRVRDGELDAAVVAFAGLRRLGRAGEASRVLPYRDFLPAPAQGALALVVRAGESGAHDLARVIDHAPSRSAVEAEREFARTLGADCRTPLAAHARVAGERIRLTGELLSPDGRTRLRASRSGSTRSAAAVGRGLAEAFLAQGASALLEPTGR